MKRTMKTIGLTALTVMALTACGGGSDSNSGYTPHPYDAPPISESDKNAYLSAINGARAVGRTCGKYGYFPPAPPYFWSDALYKAAYEHSEDMNAVGVLTHDGSGTESDWTTQVQNLDHKSTPTDRVLNNNWEGDAGENAGYGTTSLRSIMDAWLKSDGHCVGIMFHNTAGNKEGLGMARVGLYWTLDLGEGFDTSKY